MTDLILHQYEISPFSEKVRVALGIKQLAWRACNQPPILPKPHLTRLTGGFRRIPVLQIGADLYFDSQFIIEELERRSPAPTAFAGGAGLAAMLAPWSDGELFMTIVGLLFGGDWDVPEAFLKDRSELMGRPFDPAAMAATAPQLTTELRRQLDLVETQLGDGRPFLTGAAPEASDAAVYCQLTFIRWGKGRTAAVLGDFPRLLAWEKRVAALGHGKRLADMNPEEAIAIATETAPAPIRPGAPSGDIAPGDRIRFRFHDANTPVLEATLLRADARGLTVRPTASEAGAINLHFPRAVGALTKVDH
jgi:glutathione S-transferase